MRDARAVRGARLRRDTGNVDSPAGGASGAPRFVLRDAVAGDAEAVLALNNAAVPNVNRLDAETLARIVALAAHYRVAVDAEGVAGFVLCLPHGRDYWSDNYRWFSERHPEFLYLDRVVVAERVRGQGVGTMLYGELHAAARGRWPRVALEVNLDPPNPGSVRFHERLGYARVGERTYADGAVIMYVREV
jgi:predicted GNAT superfamily acetyltransferase